MYYPEMEIERRGDTFTARVKPLDLDEISAFKYFKVNHRITHNNKISLRELFEILDKKEYKDQHAEELWNFFAKNHELMIGPHIIRHLEVKHKDGANIHLRILANQDAYWAWESNSDYRPTVPVKRLQYCELTLEGDFKNEDLILNYELGFLSGELQDIYDRVQLKSDASDGSLLTYVGGGVGKIYANNHVDPTEREKEYAPVDIDRKIYYRKKVPGEGEDTFKTLEAVEEARRLLEQDLANYKRLTS